MYVFILSHQFSLRFSDYLVNRAEITLASLDKMQQSHMVYLGNRNGKLVTVCVCIQVWRCEYVTFVYLMLLCYLLDASGLLRAVTQFSHLAADTIVNAAATSHSAPTDQADRKRHTLCKGDIVNTLYTTSEHSLLFLCLMQV